MNSFRKILNKKSKNLNRKMTRFLCINFLMGFVTIMCTEEQYFFVSNEVSSEDTSEITEVASNSKQSLVSTLTLNPSLSQPEPTELEAQRPSRFGPLEYLLISLGVCLLFLIIGYKLRKLIKRHCFSSNPRSTGSLKTQQIKYFPRTSTKNFNDNLSQQNYDYIEFVGI